MSTETEQLEYAMKAFKEAEAAFVGADWISYHQDEKTLEAAKAMQEQVETAEAKQLKAAAIKDVQDEIYRTEAPHVKEMLKEVLGHIISARSPREIALAIEAVRAVIAGANDMEIEDEDHPLTLEERFQLLDQLMEASHKSNEAAQQFSEEMHARLEINPDALSPEAKEAFLTWDEQQKTREEKDKALEEAKRKEIEAANGDKDKLNAIWDKYADLYIKEQEKRDQEDAALKKALEENLQLALASGDAKRIEEAQKAITSFNTYLESRQPVHEAMEKVETQIKIEGQVRSQETETVDTYRDMTASYTDAKSLYAAVGAMQPDPVQAKSAPETITPVTLLETLASAALLKDENVMPLVSIQSVIATVTTTNQPKQAVNAQEEEALFSLLTEEEPAKTGMVMAHVEAEQLGELPLQAKGTTTPVLSVRR